MKTILKVILLSISCSLFAQQPQSLEQLEQQEDVFWQTATTQVQQGINMQNGLPYLSSGINYSRITPFANLYQYNEPDYNIADAIFFEQTLSELYRASNKTKFVNDNSFLLAKNTTALGTYAIGIINTDFDFLNYTEDDENLGGLHLVNGVYQPIAGKPSAYTKHITVVSVLQNTIIAYNNMVSFSIAPQLFFNFNKKITQINANFGNGDVPLVANEVAVGTLNVNYATGGSKTITFNITYVDGSTFTTYAIVNVVLDTQTNNNNQRVASSCTIKTDVIPYLSKIPYQAWTETTPLYGKLEYKIFYANSNQTGICGIDRVKKPFIVIDGFDPADKRKIELEDCDGNCQEANKDALTDSFIPDKYKSLYTLMSYKLNITDLSSEYIVPVLQQKGFDVIVINLPSDRNPNDYKEVWHDYGADFIERNSMSCASFLKDLNASMQTRGITEKAVVIGPSMGGQITRYALAYMEKKQQETGNATWSHNTRLWVSMDSPHQGANVPLSIQGSTYFMGYVRKNKEIKKKYEEKLLAPATREMLIEHCEEAVKNLSTNQPSPYFTSYHSNLESNGLPNSKGYPINLRKIAITNGSLSGKEEASSGQTALDMRGYIDFSIKILGVRIGWNINLFRSTQNYQYPYGSGGKIYTCAASALSSDLWLSQGVSRTTVNSFGSLDVVSGGLANSVNDFKEESIGALNKAHLRKDMRIPSTQEGIVVPHSFISTHSALDTNGFINWHQPINSNLVCTGQTPFDSYFGEAVNRDHIFFTKESINWLLKELGDSTTPPAPQPPSFPAAADAITGDTKVCIDNSLHTYSIDACKAPSAITWAVPSNLQIVSQTAYSVTVKGAIWGATNIIASFANNTSSIKNIEVGTQTPTITALGTVYGTDYYLPGVIANPPHNSSEVSIPLTLNSISITGNHSATDWEWENISGRFSFLYNAVGNKATGQSQILRFTAGIPDKIEFRCRAKGVCGWSEWKNFSITFSDGKPLVVTPVVPAKYFSISPNPASNNINIILNPSSVPPPGAQSAPPMVAVYTPWGQLKIPKTSIQGFNYGSLNISSLTYGYYVLTVYWGSLVESHNFMKN